MFLWYLEGVLFSACRQAELSYQDHVSLFHFVKFLMCVRCGIFISLISSADKVAANVLQNIAENIEDLSYLDGLGSSHTMKI